jgi:transcriptional regulator with XRE-family HTH domain
MAKDELPKAICARVVAGLRNGRIQARMPMIQLAEKSGLSVAMISYVERGLRSPTLDTLLRMAGALDIDLWKLLKKASGTKKMSSD